MKRALLAFMCIVVFSCNSGSISEIEDLKQENAALRYSVDSLRNALTSVTYREPRPVKGKKKKISKKGSGSNSAAVSQALPYSAFSAASTDDSKQEARERTTYQTAAPEPVRYTPSHAVSSYSGRCQAMTKKGSQCKRTASGGSYCWQHGG